MKYRALGNDLTVSAVSLGCMGMTHAYGAPSEEKTMLELIAQAVDLGCTMFDTAECYIGTNSDGSTAYNEEFVGKGLKPYRDKVVIATKFGVRHTPEGLDMDSRPETIRKAIDGSLKRLGVDCIDLYYQHRVDPKVPEEDVAGVMADLIRTGKITHWGISEATEEIIRRAHAVCPLTAVQNRYSMMARDYEALFPTLEELNIGFVAFSPLGNGFLSDRYTKDSKFAAGVDYRSHMPQFTAKGMEDNRPLLECVRAMASEKNATPAQIALAWMLCKKPYIVPIPGTRKPQRLIENLGAADVALTDSEEEEIDRVLAERKPTEVYGVRK